MKIIVILQIYGISYRSSNRFFNNHPELMNLVGIGKIPDFRTLSYRALRIDWHEINAGIIDLIESNGENAAIDSFIAKTCRYATAQRRRKSGKYKDPESSWGYGTKGFEYGRKTHVAQDVDSPALGEWKVTTASIHDSIMAFPMIDVFREHQHILIDVLPLSSGQL